MTIILCVEDEPLVREDIVEALEDHGYEVLQSCDGSQGLEMILKYKPDLVISDITMPRMSGHELVKTLREKHPQFADTPFIFLSALADRQDVLEGMNFGADDYLTKPIEFDLLISKTQAILRQVARMQARKEQQLTYMAHHDPLTGLANRVLLNERIEEALQLADKGQGFAVLFLDLDRFKPINDSLGHSVGDELLKAVGERLQSCLNETDTVARLGGDEFAVVQRSSHQPQDATVLARRICEVIKAPFGLGDHQVVVDTSIGIAVAPADGCEPSQLLKNADLALYEAKSQGGGQHKFFQLELGERMQARGALEIDLRKALENGEFELYYQPRLNIKQNKVTGFEALLRWNHPEHGVASREDFIRIAEATGLIHPLGEWVLDQACAEAASWPEDFCVAVNLSPVQIRNPSLPLRVANALAKSGLPASQLELEVTETVLMDNDEHTTALLHQLRDLGAKLVMDDFGTGYSSMSYLRSFPFDKVKIDRSFISDLTNREGAVEIVRAVSNLASALGMATTAEGVETEHQLEIVRAEGCTEAQGYLLSPPKSAMEIVQLFMQPTKIKTGGAA